MKTFAHLLAQHAARCPDAPAMRYKALGIWQVWTWSGLDELCTRIACGLHDAGLKAGERVAVLGGNTPNFYAALIATQALGAVPLAIGPDASQAEVEQVLAACEAKLAIAQDQEQVDKVLAARRARPQLAQVFYDNGRGLRSYAAASVAPLHGLVERGAHFAARHPGFMDIQRSRTLPSDDAVWLLASPAKGDGRLASLQHRLLIDRAQASARGLGLSAGDEVMACSPLSQPGQFLCGFAQWLACGFTLSCAESADSIDTDLREVGPTYLFGPPGMYEAWHIDATRRLQMAGEFQRRAIALADRLGRIALDGGRPLAWERVAEVLTDACVFAPLRNALGLARVRAAHVTDGEMGREARAFFRGIGIRIEGVASQGLATHDLPPMRGTALKAVA